MGTTAVKPLLPGSAAFLEVGQRSAPWLTWSAIRDEQSSPGSYPKATSLWRCEPSCNALGFRTRKGNLWDKGAVIQTLQQSAAGGVVRWGVHHRGRLQPPDKWITLPVEPIIDAKTYALVKELCEQRRPTERPGRASAKPRVLTGPRALRALRVELPARDLGQVAGRSDVLVLLLQLPQDAARWEEGVPGLPSARRRPRRRRPRRDRRHRVHAQARGKTRAPTPLAANSRGHHGLAELHPAGPRHRPDLRAPAHRPRRRAR